MREESRTLAREDPPLLRRYWNTRAVAVVRPLRVARSLPSAPADLARRGPRCARQAAAPASTFAVPGALTLARAAAGRRARSLRFGLRLRSLRSLRPGPWRPGARGSAGNKLPWHLPEDFKWFKQQTLGKTLLMGRKTFESIGRPLPGRTTLVLSRSAAPIPGVTVIHSFAELVAAALTAGEVMVCGGAEIYLDLPQSRFAAGTPVALPLQPKSAKGARP